MSFTKKELEILDEISKTTARKATLDKKIKTLRDSLKLHQTKVDDLSKTLAGVMNSQSAYDARLVTLKDQLLSALQGLEAQIGSVIIGNGVIAQAENLGRDE